MPDNAPKTQPATPNAQEWALAREAAFCIRQNLFAGWLPSTGLTVEAYEALVAFVEHCATTHTGITAAEAGRRASRPHAHATEADRREARRAAMARWRAKKKKK